MFKTDVIKYSLRCLSPENGKTDGDLEEGGSLESRVNVGLGGLRAVSVSCNAAEEGKKNLVL